MLGIFFLFNFESRLSKGFSPVFIWALKCAPNKFEPILKNFKKKYFKYFQKTYNFLRIFPRFSGSRSLRIRALFFQKINTWFYIEFRRYGRALKVTSRYEDYKIPVFQVSKNKNPPKNQERGFPSIKLANGMIYFELKNRMCEPTIFQGSNRHTQSYIHGFFG